MTDTETIEHLNNLGVSYPVHLITSLVKRLTKKEEKTLTQFCKDNNITTLDELTNTSKCLQLSDDLLASSLELKQQSKRGNLFSTI